MAAQLALGALGVTLIYGILRFSNFAHGDTMAFGAMATILVTWGLQAAGIGFGPLAHRAARPALRDFAVSRFWLLAHRPTAVYRFYRGAEGEAGDLRHRLAGRDVHL